MYTMVAAFDYFYWVFGAWLGGTLGSILAIQIKGLAFAMTALFLVLALDQILKEKSHVSSVSGLVITVVCLALVGSTYFLLVPFRLFQRGNQTPRYIQGLGEFLPGAIMVMLVVYCLRNVTWLSGNHGWPDLIACTLTILVHLKWRSLFASMIIGTTAYILMVNFVF